MNGSLNRALGQEFTSSDHVKILTDNAVGLVSTSDLVVDSNGDATPVLVSTAYSLPSLFWALQEAWIQYNNHRLYQSHAALDTINTVTVGNMPTPNTIIDSVNALLYKFNAHRTSPQWHGIGDISSLALTPATSLDGAYLLLRTIRESINAHTNNAGLHLGDSQSYISAPLEDSLVLNLKGQKVAESYDFSTRLVVKTNYPINQTTNYRSGLLLSFLGVGRLPFLTSAIPLPAVSLYRENPGFTSDSVQVFFSKPMKTSELDLLTISGGTVTVTNKAWTSDYSAELNVLEMTNTTYSVSATGLTDVYGNQVT
jgi:hypothetical protein